MFHQNASLVVANFKCFGSIESTATNSRTAWQNIHRVVEMLKNAYCAVLLLLLNLCAPCKLITKGLQLWLLILITAVAPLDNSLLFHRPLIEVTNCMCFQALAVPTQLYNVRVVWAVDSSGGNYKHLERVCVKLQCRYFAQLFPQHLCTSQSCTSQSYTSRSAFCHLSFVSHLLFLNM